MIKKCLYLCVKAVQLTCDSYLFGVAVKVVVHQSGMSAIDVTMSHHTDVVTNHRLDSDSDHVRDLAKQNAFVAMTMTEESAITEGNVVRVEKVSEVTTEIAEIDPMNIEIVAAIVETINFSAATTQGVTTIVGQISGATIAQMNSKEIEDSDSINVALMTTTNMTGDVNQTVKKTTKPNHQSRKKYRISV